MSIYVYGNSLHFITCINDYFFRPFDLQKPTTKINYSMHVCVCLCSLCAFVHTCVYSCIIALKSNNQSYKVQITPLVIYGLGGGHTHINTNT